MQIEDIIKYENESTFVEFKAIQYKKEQYSEFLRDVMAMANADTNNDRFIICGVKPNEGHSSRLIGLKELLIDGATFQQLIESNIEPSLKIEYNPFIIGGNSFGVFKISDCQNQPYMMKKDYGNALKKGDSYIRKGTFKERLTRGDIDRINERKLTKLDFTGEIECDFENSSNKILEIAVKTDINLPSERARQKIEKIIEEKEEKIKKFPGLAPLMQIEIASVFGGTPYENRTIETLKRNLISVEHDYSKDDEYYIFSQLSEKINLNLLNKGQEYLNDVTVDLFMEKRKGILVYDEIVTKPISEGLLISHQPEVNWSALDYPDVKTEAGFTKISSSIGDLKHNIPVKAFGTPLRICFLPSMIGSEVNVDILLHGKNLKTPIRFQRLIKCV